MIGTPAEFHIKPEGLWGSNSLLDYLMAKFKARTSCKCGANGMKDDEFARKFLVQGFLNMMKGGSFTGESGKGDFNEECLVRHSIWDLLSEISNLMDYEFNIPQTCTVKTYQSEVSPGPMGVKIFIINFT
jgi:hypothetical protein